MFMEDSVTEYTGRPTRTEAATASLLWDSCLPTSLPQLTLRLARSSGDIAQI
jgi:hypothetical protein